MLAGQTFAHLILHKEKINWSKKHNLSFVFYNSIQDLKERIRQRTNLPLGPSIDTHGETFLSPELVVNLLQETRHAFERCHRVRLFCPMFTSGALTVLHLCFLKKFKCVFFFDVTQLSDPSDLPKNAFSIFLLLVDHLCVEHIDYALEIGLSGKSNLAH